MTIEQAVLDGYQQLKTNPQYNGSGYVNPYSLIGIPGYLAKSSTTTPCDCKIHATQWNGVYQQWECSNCHVALSNDPSYMGGYKTELNPIPQWTKQTKACTCGSEKTYGTDATHSTWCDKYGCK